MALFNGMTQQWTKVPYAGNRSDTGFNLFSRASEGAVLDNYAELQGFFFFNAVLSDADTELAEEKAALFFADSRAYLDIVVGFGQSNMSGRADTSGVTRFDGVDGSQIKMADSYRGFFSYAFGSSQDIGSDASNSQFGLESELARLIDENSSTLTAIAKSSEGGTSLAVDWNPLNGPNYADAIQRVLLFRHLVRMQGFEPRIKALVWMQGEKDAADSVLTSQASYESLLEALILDFRGHFGADIPVVICQIKITAPGYSGSADIQAAQAAVAANVSGATLIDTSGPQFTLSDGVHFDAAGQIELGAAVYSAIYG
jgi:hypothetical protein